MKPYIAFIIFHLIFSSCASQKRNENMKQKEAKNLEVVQNKVWHTGITLSNQAHDKEQDFNRFSDDVYIHFLDRDSVELIYVQYSPGIGRRMSSSKGKYQLNKDNEIVLNLIEPDGQSMSLGAKKIQYHLDLFNNVRNDTKLTSNLLAEFPMIKTYNLFISKEVDKDAFKAALFLEYVNGERFQFGEYEFDTKPYVKSISQGNPNDIPD